MWEDLRFRNKGCLAGPTKIGFNTGSLESGTQQVVSAGQGVGEPSVDGMSYGEESRFSHISTNGGAPLGNLFTSLRKAWVGFIFLEAKISQIFVKTFH